MSDNMCALILDVVDLPRIFADAETVVYWDVEDFPVTDIVSFNENIKLALGKAGYHGKVSIRAYYGGDKKPKVDEEEAAGFTFVSRGSKRARMHSMLLDMHLLELDNPSRALTNLMVITKNLTWDEDEDETQFTTCLLVLNAECYNILLVVFDDYQELRKLPRDLNYTAWLWEELSSGGDPLAPGLIQPFRELPPHSYIGQEQKEQEEKCRCPCCGE